MRADEEQGVICVLDMVVVDVVYCVIYHDFDVVVVDDIVKLWETNLLRCVSSKPPNTTTRISPSTSRTRFGLT